MTYKKAVLRGNEIATGMYETNTKKKHENQPSFKGFISITNTALAALLGTDTLNIAVWERVTFGREYHSFVVSIPTKERKKEAPQTRPNSIRNTMVDDDDIPF